MRGLLRDVKRRVSQLTKTREERRHELVGTSGNWKLKRDFQIRFLREAGLRPEHHFLDIGCGVLRGGIPVIDFLEEGHYFGIDARKEVVEEAQQELRDAGLEGKNPTLIAEPDITQVTLERHFDLVWSFSVLIHMTDQVLLDTLRFVRTHFTDQGLFYANVNVGDRKTGSWQGFPVVHRSREFYEEACEKSGLVLTDIGSLRELGHISNVESQDSQRMLAIRSRPA